MNIIIISDIHFDKNEPENQKKVLTAFFEDLQAQIPTEEKDFTYCFISGDLVSKAGIVDIYDEFYSFFIKRLISFVPLQHIYVVAGNHDLNRQYVESKFDEFQNILTDYNTESLFNKLCAEENNLLNNKFKAFNAFVKKHLPHIPYNQYGYHVNITPEQSVFFLNSALNAFGGANGFVDEGNLCIETSKLNEWIQDTEGRNRILVMHHPLEHLSPFASEELKTLLTNKIDFLFDGHIHTHTSSGGSPFSNHQYVRLGTPQLFSDKTDLNGYCIVKFNGFNIDTISYRQWNQRHMRFLNGVEFTGNDDGCYHNAILNGNINDVIQQHLYSYWEDAMTSYGHTPDWVERKLTTTPPSVRTENISEIWDYISILSSDKDIQILGGKQFGLTCYARYLALKAWERNRECWVYISHENITLSNFEKKISLAKSQIYSNTDIIKCIIIDNWISTAPRSAEMLSKIKATFSKCRIILLSNQLDSSIIKGITTPEENQGFISLYLREIDGQGLRVMALAAKESGLIKLEIDKAIIRLRQDLSEFNLHRTPLNCLQILIGFASDINAQSVNRAKIMTRVLQFIFENPNNYDYKGGNTLSEGDCKFIMGYFCEFLARNNRVRFTEKEFVDTCTEFCIRNKKDINVGALLDILKFHRLITVCEDNSLHFRFITWQNYFTAARMVRSADFLDYMIKEHHALYQPDLIEFYTGLDDGRSDITKLLTQELGIVIDKVATTVKDTNLANLYESIKWNMSDEQREKTVEQLEQSLKESALPDEIKDSISDTTYDPSKPYFQIINDFIESHGIRNLFELTRSACRALRNCDYTDVEEKERLLDCLLVSTIKIGDIVFLLSGALAKNGYCGYGGQGFRLDGDFGKEFEVRLKQIIINIPYNITRWFKDDIFSDSLTVLFEERMISHPNSMARHLLALIISMECAPNFKSRMLKYIGGIGKKSFYLADLFSGLRTNYQYEYLTPSEQNNTAYLIKVCYSKHISGGTVPGVDAVNKVNNNILPAANSGDM